MSKEENKSVEEESLKAPNAVVTDQGSESDKKKEVTAEDLLISISIKPKYVVLKVLRTSIGIVNVLATFNNKVTFCDTRGNVISWSSAGKCNFRGSRKSTAYAAQVVTQDAGRVAILTDEEVTVKLNGPVWVATQLCAHSNHLE